MIGDRKYFHSSSLHLRTHDRVGGHVDLDHSGRQIRDGSGRVLVWHFRHLESEGVQIAGKDEIGKAGGGGPVQLAGLGARQCLQFFQRTDVQRGWYADRNNSLGNSCDRDQVASWS